VQNKKTQEGPVRSPVLSNRHSLLFMNSLLNAMDSAKETWGNELMESNE